MATELIPYGNRLLRRFVQNMLYRDHWHILVGHNLSEPHDAANFRPLLPPDDRFWADPFVIYENGQHYLFLEEYLYNKKKGVISVLEVNIDGTHSNAKIVLEEEHHLSHPFIFKWDNTYYMIPESGCNRTIDLYECIKFPHQWQFKRHLMEDVYAVDTTLVEHKGKWWLFTGQEQSYRGLDGDAINLYWADSPLANEWHPHPLNPVVSNCSHSRPGGCLYHENGKLYRPAQNSKKHYGHAIAICEIEELSETAYRESVVKQIFPSWNKNTIGIHTLNREGEMTVIDAFQHKRRW
jgi:hypothetical protein